MKFVSSYRCFHGWYSYCTYSGEMSSGSKDDVIRHISLSSLHLFGYNTRNVLSSSESIPVAFNVGEPGLDDLRDIEYLSKGALEKLLGVTIDRKLLLVPSILQA